MIWDALKYGWNVAYVLVIEGVSTIWSELDTSLTLPAGFDQLDASLVIDKSAGVGQMVDRDSGMGQGLPLSFQLLDSVAARAMVQRWQNVTYLTAGLTAAAGTIAVNDAAGFAGSGSLWLGQERVTYTGTTSTTFTGCSRGTAWSPARRHLAQGAAAVVTDQPKVWRGRGIRLFAVPVAPDGSIASDDGTLLAEAVEVWRGYIDQGPNRESGRFAFSCLSLDRMLSQTLPTAASGTVVDAAMRVPVYPADTLELRVVGYGGGGWDFLIRCYPYEDLANGTLLTVAEQRDLIIASWAAAVTDAGAGAHIGALFAEHKIGVEQAGKNLLMWVQGYRWNLELFADATTEYVLIQGTVGTDSITGSFATTGGLPDTTVELPWISVNRMLANVGYTEATGSDGVCIQLDTVLDDVPATGLVQIGSVVLSYSDSATQGGLLYLSGLVDAKGQGFVWPKGKAPVGASAQLLFRQEGPASDLMLSLLTSEGGGGSYDVWGYAEGYSLTGGSGLLSTVDEASFSLQLAGPALDFVASIGGSEASFEGSFGGLLALAQRGIVARPDSTGYVRLGIVSTEPAGSAYVATVTDAELLSLRGEPVEQVSRSEPLAGLRISLSSYGDEEGDTFTLQEFAGLTEQAGRTLELTLPVAGGQDVSSQVQSWGASLLAQTSTLQTLELKVVPWVPATVGDLIRVQVTHPNVWSWLSGSPGYDGLGRVLGAVRDLKDGSLTLTVLIDGAISTSGLVPSMLVLAGSGTTPSVIDVSRLHLPHLQEAFAAGTLVLRHYQPGRDNEAGGGTLSVSSVTDTGSVCRLVVTGSVPVAVDTAHRSTLCYPELASCNDYQSLFAHVGDGSVWS